MKKRLVLFIILCLILFMSSCTNKQNENTKKEFKFDSSTKSQEELQIIQAPETPQDLPRPEIEVFNTLTQIPNPKLIMYLKKYPLLSFKELQVYSVSPGEEVVLQCNKEIDKKSLLKAFLKIAPDEEWELNWINENLATVSFFPPNNLKKTYQVYLRNIKSIDGDEIIVPECIDLIVAPQTSVFCMSDDNEKKEIGKTNGGFIGGKISPDGKLAVFWEWSSYFGDVAEVRYWLQNWETEDRVYLTENVARGIKWYPDNSFQISNKNFNSDGELIKGDLEEKIIIGFDISTNGDLSYVSISDPKESVYSLDLCYKRNNDTVTIKKFTYPIYSNSQFLLSMDPSYNPTGDKLAVAHNSSIDDNILSSNIYIIDPISGEKQLLFEGGEYVLWSPTGDYLAIGYINNGIDIVAVSGEKIENFPDYYFNAVKQWMPNGRCLLIVDPMYRENTFELIDIFSKGIKEYKGIPLGFDLNNNLYYIEKPE